MEKVVCLELSEVIDVLAITRVIKLHSTNARELPFEVHLPDDVVSLRVPVLWLNSREEVFQVFDRYRVFFRRLFDRRIAGFPEG